MLTEDKITEIFAMADGSIKFLITKYSKRSATANSSVFC